MKKSGPYIVNGSETCIYVTFTIHVLIYEVSFHL